MGRGQGGKGMKLSKLRPVGSRVPKPVPSFESSGLQVTDYELEYFDSGTSALSVAIQCSLTLKSGYQSPEVVVPAYACPDVISAIVYQGLTPRLVDLEANTPWMDLDFVRDVCSENTVAIVAVNFLGIPERLPELRRIADEFGVALIEDSAQMFPPVSASSGVAEFAILSFGRGKPINLMGGGALLIRRDVYPDCGGAIDDLRYKERSSGIIWFFRRLLFNALLVRTVYGILEKLPFLGLGQTKFHPLNQVHRVVIDSRLLSAGVANLDSRDPLEASYAVRLGPLTERDWILLPEVCRQSRNMEDGRRQKLLRYSLLAPSYEQRETAVNALNAAGIGANALYKVPLPDLPGLSRYFGANSSRFTEAESFADRLLTLPCHEDVRSSDLDQIEAILFEAAGDRKL